MTDDEINALARKIADRISWWHLRNLSPQIIDGISTPEIALFPTGSEYTDLYGRYLDARGLLERPDPANPNIVRRKEQHD